MTNTTSSASPDPRWFVRWFVQYNPMFTASALCVIGGVLLLARALGDDKEVALTGVLELYQALVIGTAALLYRRLNEHRPGVILGLIALVFLVDPTLSLGALAASGAFAATVAWVALFAAKWRALEWAFCLRMSWTSRALPVLGAAFVAALPNARLLDDVGPQALPTAIAVSVFGLGAIAVLGRLRITSRRALGDVGVTMFPRLLRAAVVIGVGGVVYQCGNTVFAIGPAAMLVVVGALALVAVVATRSEARAWLCAAGGLALCGAGGLPATFALSLAAAALLVSARDKAPRVFNAGIVVAVAAAYASVGRSPMLGAHDPGAIVVVLVATAALVYVLVRRRGWSAIPALVVVHWRVALLAAAAVERPSEGQWGTAMLLAGFALIPVGVVVHRRLARLLDDGLGPATESSPTTPASAGAALA